MMKKYIVILLLPFFSFSQDEKLRIETINVFKEYKPAISNSRKISEQPIFNDTLKVDVSHSKSILNKDLQLYENIINKKPSKFRLNTVDQTLNKYVFLNFGTHSFLNTKFHYNNGLSIQHNSGFYIEHSSEDYRFQSPNYKKLNGELFNSIKLYSNRFLNTKLLETSFELNRRSGLYWAGLEDESIDVIADYIGRDLHFQANLNQMSNENFLNSIDFQFNYFSHNYGRQETMLSSLFNFDIEKALKTYSLSLSFNMINTNMNADWSSVNANGLGLNSQVSTALYLDQLVDVVVKSKFVLTASKVVDYTVGFDIQHCQMGDIYSDIDSKSSHQLIFPTIHILKQIDNNQKVEFVLKKDLIYTSFKQLFYQVPYVDPYFRNSLTKDMRASLLYNKKISNNVSFFSSINYRVIQDKPVPFLITNTVNTAYASLYLSNGLMSPLGFYLSNFNGVDVNSSLTFSKSKYNILVSANLSLLNSDQHIDRTIIPRFTLNGSLTLHLFENIDLVSDWKFVGRSEAMRLSTFFVPHAPLEYESLNSFINTNLSIKYSFENMIFSIDFRNLLGQKIELFDGYYDDDRFKVSCGFFYKF